MFFKIILLVSIPFFYRVGFIQGVDSSFYDAKNANEKLQNCQMIVRGENGFPKLHNR